MTWTLCSILNPIAALIEMRRILILGGRLHFVRAWTVTRTSDRPLAAPFDAILETGRWRSHLDRQVVHLIRAAGFGLDEIQTGYMKGPKPWTLIYHGSATN